MACKVVAHGEEARRVVAGGARGGDRQRTRRRLEVGAHRGEAVEEGRRRRGGPQGEVPRAAALRPSWRKKGKEGEGDDEWVLRVKSIFLEWSRGIDGETVGSPTL